MSSIKINRICTIAFNPDGREATLQTYPPHALPLGGPYGPRSLRFKKQDFEKVLESYEPRILVYSFCNATPKAKEQHGKRNAVRTRNATYRKS